VLGLGLPRQLLGVGDTREHRGLKEGQRDYRTEQTPGRHYEGQRGAGDKARGQRQRRDEIREGDKRYVFEDGAWGHPRKAPEPDMPEDDYGPDGDAIQGAYGQMSPGYAPQGGYPYPQVFSSDESAAYVPDWMLAVQSFYDY
jgi:hypothetical protein